MEGILIPIDFSACSINALKYGLNLAGNMGLKVNIIHGYHVPIPAAEFSMSISPAMIKEFKDEAVSKFNDLKNEMPLLKTLPINFNVKMAFALDAILNAISESKPDFVVMGTKGSSGLAEVVMGSNTSGVIKNSNVPVIAVPQNFSGNGINKITLACDMEPIKDLSHLTIINRLTELNNSTVEIVHVSKEDSSPSVDHSKQALELDEFFGDIPHNYHYLKSNDIAEALENFIEENKMDLLAMIPRKHNLIEKLFKASITKKMAHHCTIPLLAIPC